MGPQPTMVVQQAEATIANGGVCSAFAGAVQGVPLDVVFTISNTGNSDLHLRDNTPIDFSGVSKALFSVLTAPSATTIKPQGSSNFTIRFILDSPGTKTALIYVYNDDSKNNPYGITVSNTALPRMQVILGTVIQNGGSCNLANTTSGQYADAAFTIKNIGTVQLDLTGTPKVSISGAGGANFTVTVQPSSPILPNGITTFTIRFLPTAPGTMNATISIANSDVANNPFTFSLIGICALPLSHVVLAAGSYHTVALKTDGTVWAWGLNSNGQLGDGTTTSALTPVQVTGLSGVSAIAAGGSHTVALKTDGTVWAWETTAMDSWGTELQRIDIALCR